MPRIKSANRFYVYLILDPTNFYLPFYVGKGEGRRALVHLTSAYTHNKGKRSKISDIRDKGFEPVIFYWKKDLFEQEAYDLEVKLIDRFGRQKHGGILTNIARDRRPPGMTGKRHSEKTKQFFRESRKGRVHLDSTRKLIGENQTGSKNQNALVWHIITPDGDQHVVNGGLRTWCKDNGHQFTKVYNSRSGYATTRNGKGKGGGRPKGS